MSNKNIVGEVRPLQPEEVNAFLEAYKLKNPVKFAQKEARGEFDSLKASLPKKDEEDKPKRGRPSKDAEDLSQ